MPRNRVLLAFAVLSVLLIASAGSAGADPIGLQWPQPGGPGTPVVITYSYSNLLDGALLLMTPQQLRAATEEAFRLWASYAPLHFLERPDAGPPPSDMAYDAAGIPSVRIGHHSMVDWAHAYYPGTWGGLAGDIHFATGAPWSLNDTGTWNYLEVITHEIGHVLGLGHELREEAMMNPFFPRRYSGLGSAYLLPADISHIRAVYGAGRGTVQPFGPAPVPEPGTLLLTAIGAAVLLRRRRARKTVCRSSAS
jgi:hypothetical protein